MDIETRLFWAILPPGAQEITRKYSIRQDEVKMCESTQVRGMRNKSEK